ncbi:MAG: GTPase [Desulfurococcaceae archaeon]
MKSTTASSISRYYVKNYEELYEYINENLKKIKARNGELFGDLMKRKLTYTYQVLTRELQQVHQVLREICSQGDFFKELFKAYTGENIEYFALDIRKRIKQSRLIYSEIIEEYFRIGYNNREAVKAFKRGIGRLLSIYKRINKKIIPLKEYLKEVSKMPDIRGDYVVVFAGLPQVGKSTILSKLTSAKPEIGTYPFTTKTLIAGHLIVEPYGRIVLLDSPGILDSPIEEKNIIEYKAILAIKYLADHVLYVFAVYPSFYYTLNEQLNVYYSVRKLVGGKPVTLLINKVDLVDKALLEETMVEIEKHTGVKPIPISALTGYNLNIVRDILIKEFMGKNQYL